MKRLIKWLYYRFVYLPEVRRKVAEINPDIVIVPANHHDPIMMQAQRERKWISDDRLH